MDNSAVTSLRGTMPIILTDIKTNVLIYIYMRLYVLRELKHQMTNLFVLVFHKLQYGFHKGPMFVLKHLIYHINSSVLYTVLISLKITYCQQYLMVLQLFHPKRKTFVVQSRAHFLFPSLLISSHYATFVCMHANIRRPSRHHNTQPPKMQLLFNTIHKLTHR